MLDYSKSLMLMRNDSENPCDCRQQRFNDLKQLQSCSYYFFRDIQDLYMVLLYFLVNFVIVLKVIIEKD